MKLLAILLFFSTTLLGQDSSLYKRALSDISTYNGEPYMWACLKKSDFVGVVVYTNGTNEAEYSFYLLPSDTITRAIIQIETNLYVSVACSDSEAVIMEWYKGEVSKLAHGIGKRKVKELDVILDGDYKVIFRNGKLHVISMTKEDYFIVPEY